MIENSFELRKPLSVCDLIRWVVARRGAELRENFCNIDRDRFARTPNGMLLNYMARNGEKICFRATDALVAFDAQKSQKNLLGKIRDVRGVAQAYGKKTAQPAAVSGGDPRDEDKVNHGFSDLADLVKQGESKTNNEFLHTALIQVESTESSCADNFAKPLLAKRHQVDSGDATVSDLQIFYLQKDPASWLTKSSTVLDEANTDTGKALKQSESAASTASKISFCIVVFGTIFAIIFGLLQAVRTSKSITEPLQHLITVAQEIGNSGDLDQNIAVHVQPSFIGRFITL